MRRRSLVLVALLIAALLAGGGAVYAYDQGKRETIAGGLSVNGVEVGGLSEDAARERLRAALLEPLDRPVVVRHAGRRFTLTPEEAEIGVDVDGSVARALERSRAGSMLSRTWRSMRGTPVDEDLEAKVSWSRAAVRRLVRGIERDLERDPRDASLNLSTGRIDPRPSRDGVAVRTARLRREVERALLDAGSRRPVRVRTAVVKPEVTTEELAGRYPAILIVNRSTFKLTLYKNLKPAKTYGIAVGQVGMDTPAGLYHIQNKAINPAWHVPDSDWAGKLRGKVIPGDDPTNPIKARWMGIYDGAGIHGTDAEHSIGTAASHGCIRMRIPEVVELYDQVPVNAPVYIA
jgi:lipoprotein-anchoring transpeptidase ErfK/SrfK